MAATPLVYQPLVRAEYKENETDAFHKLQGKIAIFKTLQAQTPTKMGTKEAPKAAPNISFKTISPRCSRMGLNTRLGIPSPD